MDDSNPKRQPARVLKVLEALKQASIDLRLRPSCPADSDDPDSSSAIKALLELETESETFLSSDPNLSPLSSLLQRLRALVDSLQKSRSRLGLGPFLTRRVSTRSISIVAASIERELQSWIDRNTVETLVGKLRDEKPTSEDELVSLLTRFEDRVSEGFDRELQDLILKTKTLALFESVLTDPTRSERIREHCAYVIGALIRFNKDVFVGQVLMGPAIKALVSMSTACSMKVLCDLIRTVKSPLVDEIEHNGDVSRIVACLDDRDSEMQVLGLDCALEMGYFGRKEAIDAMMKEGLVERLVALQTSDSGPPEFSRCVARFAVSLEVGEGLRMREKRCFKQQILRRVREACVSEAETATILAEVLWGSSP